MSYPVSRAEFCWLLHRILDTFLSVPVSYYMQRKRIAQEWRVPETCLNQSDGGFTEGDIFPLCAFVALLWFLEYIAPAVLEFPP